MRETSQRLFRFLTGVRLDLPLAVLCAVVTVVQPARAQYHLYWGDTHGHTSLSDGKGSPADYFAYARNVARLDFVIVTDHDFGNRAPWRMPRENWHSTQAAAEAATVEGRFVALAGYEWTSQPKYWSGFSNGVGSEHLFPGLPRFYSHKNVYFTGRVDYLFSAKDAAFQTPDLLAAAVRHASGLIQNNHPSSDPEARDQFDYDPAWSSVIANTEMLADTLRYAGKTYQVNGERVVREFLARGGRTGFVGGTDTHEGKPAARTAVLASSLTRAGIFEALRQRRNYAVSHARIVLDFKINGHFMGEEIQIDGKPRLAVAVQGTSRITEIVVVRDGVVRHRITPKREAVRFEWVDRTFPGAGCYYLRVTQADLDEEGNPSRAWSSPIWVSHR
jgi:hypothetical protein